MPRNQPIDLEKPIDYAALKDRNILITGGASGFGKAFAELFASHGANLVIGDLQDGPGKEVEKALSAKGTKIKFVHVDVTSFESQVSMIREALAFFPRNEIDLFVPNAGILGLPTTIDAQDPANLADLKAPTPDLASRMISINLSGVFVGTMLVLRYGMGLHKPVEERSSKPTKSILLIASLASYTGAEGSIEYTTTKFGVRGMLRGFRRLLANTGVRMNAVSPFYVETPLCAHAMPALREAGIPTAGIDHVVEAAVRLATDEDAYGRSVFVMPEGLSDAGDDVAGLYGAKAFSVEALGPQWQIFFTGALSDEIAE